MGYYTAYSLDTFKSAKDISEILGNLPDGEFEDLRYAIDEYGEVAMSCKWYEHEKDMKKLSLMHPDIVFELCGKGEEQGDSWKKYFKNGKVQVCEAQITYPPFDENKLKEIKTA